MLYDKAEFIFVFRSHTQCHSMSQGISLYVAQNAFATQPRVTQNALDWRHLIKLDIFSSLKYAQVIVLELRQLNIYCRTIYFMKTCHELNCYVFISRECRYGGCELLLLFT